MSSSSRKRYRQRTPAKKAPLFIVRVFRRRKATILADVKQLGFDSLKAGLASIVLNAWIQNNALVYAGLTAAAIGIIAWAIALPIDKPRRSRE